MSLSSIPGPCGLTLAEIIDLASGVGRHARHCGVNDQKKLHIVLCAMGVSLTRELTGLPTEQAIAGYHDRLHDVLPEASATLRASDVLPTCLAAGASHETAFDGESSPEAEAALLRGLVVLQMDLGVSSSEMRDLLLWIQSVLTLGKVLGGPSEPSTLQGGAHRHRQTDYGDTVHD